jgi:hypothetical protein
LAVPLRSLQRVGFHGGQLIGVFSFSGMTLGESIPQALKRAFPVESFGTSELVPFPVEVIPMGKEKRPHL